MRKTTPSMIKNGQGNIFLKFFSRPIVGIIGSIASVISVPLAIYFFVVAKETCQLTYFVHPVKSIIVASGQSSKLSVKFGEKKITSDITAAQVVILNKGRRPIRPENVLRPFVIRVGDNIPILEARVMRVSREVVNLRLDSTRIQTGEVVVSWDILEHNDGGIVQLIFAGDIKTPIIGTAIVEGQREVDVLEFPEMTPEEKHAECSRGWLISFILSSVIMAFIVLLMLIMVRSLKLLKVKAKHRKILDAMRLLLLAVVVAAIGLFLFIIGKMLWPPLGF